jgi:ABC-type lipoprotein release transport system permease subunit
VGFKIKQLLLVGQVIITSRETGFSIKPKLLTQKYSFQPERITKTIIIIIKTIIILIIICNRSISDQCVSNQ